MKIYSKYLLEPIEFTGEPIYEKVNGVYGYLIPSGRNVIFFYNDVNFNNVDWEILEGWWVE